MDQLSVRPTRKESPDPCSDKLHSPQAAVVVAVLVVAITAAAVAAVVVIIPCHPLIFQNETCARFITLKSG